MTFIDNELSKLSVPETPPTAEKLYELHCSKSNLRSGCKSSTTDDDVTIVSEVISGNHVDVVTN